MIEITTTWLEFSFTNLPIKWIGCNILSERGVSLQAGLFYPMVRDAKALALAGHEAFAVDTFLQCHFASFVFKEKGQSFSEDRIVVNPFVTAFRQKQHVIYNRRL